MHECALYSDPDLYDLLFPAVRDGARVLDPARRERIAASEAFYLSETSGQVLELGCGSGRLTIAIAKTGHNIIGIDLSASMLAAARRKAERDGVSIDFRQGSMCDFDLPERFDTILIPGNSLLHLHTHAEIERCLETVRRHLRPGGKFVFDVSRIDPSALVLNERHPAMIVESPDRGRISIDEISTYDEATQIRSVQLFLYTDDTKDFQTIECKLRVILPQELLLLLKSAGFVLIDRFGEFTRDPFTAASPRQVCICQARD